MTRVKAPVRIRLHGGLKHSRASAPAASGNQEQQPEHAAREPASTADHANANDIAEDDPPRVVFHRNRRYHRRSAAKQAMREIKRYQRDTAFLLPKAPFRRLVREVAAEIRPDSRFTDNALGALQTVAESYLTNLFTVANGLACHGSRITVKPIDMAFALVIRAFDAPSWTHA